MRFSPHLLLEDSFTFFQPGLEGRSLHWTYEAERFEVLGDKDSLQGLTLTYLEQFLRLSLSPILVIGQVSDPKLPFSPALFYQSPDAAQVHPALLSQAEVAKLISQGQLSISPSAFFLPVHEVIFEPETGPIHFGELLERYEYPEDLHLFFQLFLSSTPGRITNLEQALDEGRLTDAHRIAHSIKGSALSASAPDFAGIAKEIEIELKSGKKPANTQAVVNKLLSSFELVRAAWEAWEKEMDR